MIYTEINQSEFRDAFLRMDRNTNFSYEGLGALYEYLDDRELETNVELDVIALCCEYTEYDNLKELQENYDNIESMDDLRDHTTVIEIEGSEGFIIQDF